ncbi:MAG: hypothetical protein OEZ13_04950 [Spirochaetia bacterium]|nr:hypothetical protein [Spirochaetia bacterium]
MDSQLQKLVEDGLEKNRIRELYLYKVPTIRNVDDWTKVKEVGKIYFKGKHSTYNGGLIQYGNKYFFITDTVIVSLTKFRKWKFPTEIQVVPEEEWKKKVTEFQERYDKTNKKDIKHI